MSKEILERLDALEDGLRKEMRKVETSIKQTIVEMNEKISTVEIKCVTLQKENDNLKGKIDYLEGLSRRNNLIFYKIEESQRETWDESEEKVKAFISGLCNISLEENDIERAHRIGKRGNGERPIVVKFLRWKTRETVLRKYRKADKSKTPIRISEDFTANVKEIRHLLKPHLQKAIEEGNEAYLTYNKLIINGQAFTAGPNNSLISLATFKNRIDIEPIENNNNKQFTDNQAEKTSNQSKPSHSIRTRNQIKNSAINKPKSAINSPIMQKFLGRNGGENKSSNSTSKPV